MPSPSATTSSPFDIVRTISDDEQWMEIKLIATGQRIAYAWICDLGGWYWIDELSVHPDFRGQQLATRLLGAVIGHLGSSDIGLCCGAFVPTWDVPHQPGLTDEQLAAWYSRHGFAAAGDGTHMVRETPD